MKLPADKPLGLDLNQFQQREIPPALTGKKDLEIINEIMEKHETLLGVMQKRLGNVQYIQRLWDQGNITSSLNCLSMMHDPSIVMDVLNNTFAENQKVDQLTYENIA